VVGATQRMGVFDGPGAALAASAFLASSDQVTASSHGVAMHAPFKRAAQ